jgi:hypothetical protein
VGKGGGHGYGAFAKDDVDDAKRGEPPGSLEAYAAARGLDYKGQLLYGAYGGILPRFPDYVFNVCRGVLPGGGVGMLQHELQEVEVSTSRGIMWGGEFHQTHYTAKGRGFWNTVLPIEIFDKQPPDKPFAASALWAPVTAGVVRVPEAALLPRALVRRKERMAAGTPSLDDVGAPGYRVEANGATAEVRAAMFGGDVAEVLRTFPHPHVELMFSHSGVALRRNGFVMDDGALDDLAHAVSRVAAGLAQAGAAYHRPQPFTAELRPPGDGPPDDVPWYEWPGPQWADGYAQKASALGMASEDPVEFHRAFPTQPVPGIASGVLRGPLPGWDGLEGRLVFMVHGRGTTNSVRTAVLIAAPEGAPPIPPGGQLVPETEMYVEVVDGIAAIWNQRRSFGQLEAEPTLARALTTAGQVGFVP